MSETKERFCVDGKLKCSPKGNNFVAVLTLEDGDEPLELELGSLNLRVAIEHRGLRDEFVALMKKVITHIATDSDPTARVEFNK